MTSPKGNTPNRVIRVPDDLWNAARARAERDGTTVSHIIRDRLKRYVNTPPKEKR